MAPVTKRLFGKTKEGEPVYAYQLDDGKIKAEVLYFAILYLLHFNHFDFANSFTNQRQSTIYSSESYVQVINYGAAIRTLLVPDSKGHFEDVVLGHDSVAGYEKGDGYLGVTVGRVANRIAMGKFSVAGKTYQLEKVKISFSNLMFSCEMPDFKPLPTRITARMRCTAD